VSPDGRRAQHLTRRTGSLSGGGGEYRGGHYHQRKLFSCAGGPANEVAEYIRRITGAGEPAGLKVPAFRRDGAKCALFCSSRSLAWPCRLGFVGAGRLGELPASSFWKGWLFSLFPEKFLVMRKA
jgi:hypothetical protein